jgi:hypothetical protein
MTSAPPEKLLYIRSQSQSLVKQGLNKGLRDIHTRISKLGIAK